MGKKEKIKERFLTKKGWNNFSSNDIITILNQIGFTYNRTNGSHQIFVNKDIEKIINLQPVKGKCKPYQLK